eukprot:5090128-Amphidinium_carterae.1
MFLKSRLKSVSFREVLRGVLSSGDGIVFIEVNGEGTQDDANSIPSGEDAIARMRLLCMAQGAPPQSLATQFCKKLAISNRQLHGVWLVPRCQHLCGAVGCKVELPLSWKPLTGCRMRRRAI